MDISYGIKAAIRPTSDLASLPRSIWGKARTTFSGWGVTAFAEVDGQDFSSANLEVDAVNKEGDMSVHIEANAGSEFTVTSVEATKAFMQDGARITVTPRYDLLTEERDVIVTYSKDKTSMKLTASENAQELTISQEIDQENRVAPTFSSGGAISVEWERKVSPESSFKATLKPNDSLEIEYKDADWTANIGMPIDGTDIKGATVSISKEINF
jgi:hypothetical protein